VIKRNKAIALSVALFDVCRWSDPITTELLLQCKQAYSFSRRWCMLIRHTLALCYKFWRACIATSITSTLIRPFSWSR